MSGRIIDPPPPWPSFGHILKRYDLNVSAVEMSFLLPVDCNAGATGPPLVRTAPGVDPIVYNEVYPRTPPAEETQRRGSSCAALGDPCRVRRPAAVGSDDRDLRKPPASLRRPDPARLVLPHQRHLRCIPEDLPTRQPHAGLLQTQARLGRAPQSRPAPVVTSDPAHVANYGRS